jgi:hypothetical protein
MTIATVLRIADLRNMAEKMRGKLLKTDLHAMALIGEDEL